MILSAQEILGIVEKWDYPLKALREVVLNAIVHRDYRDPSDIQIKIYDDMTLEKIKEKNYQSSLRNKLTAEAFYLTANTEKYGTGFSRIEKELQNYPHISYEFKSIANAMQFTFFKNEGVKSLYRLIKQNPNNRSTFFAKELNTSVKNIERWLKQLKNEDKIEFKGSPKTGGYILF